MDGLRVSPLRGLIDLWIVLSYNLYIPSGLKKTSRTTNPVNTEAMCHFGLEFLFDGYLTILVNKCGNLLKTRNP